MKVAIIQYNAGNIQSVKYALERLGVAHQVTDDPELIQGADKVIFPGVGEASTAMEYLRKKNLDKVITSLKQPTLGICLGLQLMCRHSEENNTVGLGIFSQKVLKFEGGASYKVPHMGWNLLQVQDNSIFEGLKEKEYVYFVHSYYAQVGEGTIATAQYAGLDFSAVLQKNNFYAVQFHTEKSSLPGAKILENFLKL